MKNLIALILGVFLFVALTEGFSVRMSGGAPTVGFQKGAGSQQLGQLLRERRDGLAAEKNAACVEGGNPQCNTVCRSAGHDMGGCFGTNCKCFD